MRTETVARCWWRCCIRLNAGEQNRFFITAKFTFRTYIKLATFPQYRNSNGRSFHFRKKGITCSLAWEKCIRRSARFWRTIKKTDLDIAPTNEHPGLARGQIAPVQNCSFSTYPFELKRSRIVERFLGTHGFRILNFNVFGGKMTSQDKQKN